MFQVSVQRATPNSRRVVSWLFAVLMAFILGLMVGASSGNDGPSVPDCPTEDSCTVDYRDGEWYIERTYN